MSKTESLRDRSVADRCKEVLHGEKRVIKLSRSWLTAVVISVGLPLF